VGEVGDKQLMAVVAAGEEGVTSITYPADLSTAGVISVSASV